MTKITPPKKKFKHHFKLPLILSFCLFNSLFVCSQTGGLSNSKKMDSLLNHSPWDTSFVAYENYLKALNISKKVNSKKYELISYRKLMSYFGFKKNLDSMLNYAHEFENGNYQGQDKKIIRSFFFQKGYSLVYNFEMIEQSLTEYQKAYKYIDEDDIDKKIKIITSLAYNYIAKRQYDKAIEILTSLPKDSINDGQYKFYFLATLASAYQCKEIPEKSYPINQEILELAEKLKDSSNIYFVKSNIIFDYYLQGKFQKAIDSGIQIIDSLKKFDPKMLPVNFYNLSRAYDAIGKRDKAIYYMSKSLTPQKGLYSVISDYNKVESLDFLAEFYEKNNNHKKAVLTLRKRSKIIDSMRAREQKAFIDYHDVKTRIIDQQKEKERILVEKKMLTFQNNKQKQFILLLSVGVICIILIIASVFIYLKYFKSKKKIKALKNNEREILENHISIRETELSMLVTSKTKALSQLSKIKEELSKAIKENNQHQIHEIEKKLNSFLITTANDNVFSERLESQYPGMVMSLKKLHPELSQNDIKHCILIKLDLSLKESAQLLHVGTGAVKMGRNRAKTKMKIAHEISLKKYLDQIS